MIIPCWARRFTRLVQRGTEWSFRVSEGWVRTPSASQVRTLFRRGTPAQSKGWPPEFNIKSRKPLFLL
jgi:hypothetical protein